MNIFKSRRYNVRRGRTRVAREPCQGSMSEGDPKTVVREVDRAWGAAPPSNVGFPLSPSPDSARARPAGGSFSLWARFEKKARRPLPPAWGRGVTRRNVVSSLSSSSTSDRQLPALATARTEAVTAITSVGRSRRS